MSVSNSSQFDKKRLSTAEKIKEIQRRVSETKEKIKKEFEKYKISPEAQNQAMKIPKISRYYERFDPEKPNEKNVRERYLNQQVRSQKNNPQDENEHLELAEQIVVEEIEALERELQLDFSVIITENDKIYILDEGKDYQKQPKLIGQGWYGKVKFGVDPETSERVAIKIVKLQDFSPDETQIEAEVKLLKDQTKRIRREGIVYRGAIYSVYEYLGHDLNYHLATTERLESMGEKDQIKAQQRSAEDYIQDLNERLEISAKMMDRVQEVHNLGIIHRDLKADNVMYNRKTKVVRLIDYGFAHKLRKGENEAQLPPEKWTGTQTHMHPKIRLQTNKPQVFSKSTDLFSAGVTLMEIFGSAPIKIGIGKKLTFNYNVPPLNNPLTQDPNPLIQQEKQRAWKEMYKCIAEMVADDKVAIAEIEKSIGEKIKINPKTQIKTAKQGCIKIDSIKTKLNQNIKRILETGPVNNNLNSLLQRFDSINQNKTKESSQVTNSLKSCVVHMTKRLEAKGLSNILTQPAFKEITNPLHQIGYLALVLDKNRDFFHKRDTEVLLINDIFKKISTSIKAANPEEAASFLKNHPAVQKITQNILHEMLFRNLTIQSENLIHQQSNTKMIDRITEERNIILEKMNQIFKDESTTLEAKEKIFKEALSQTMDKYKWPPLSTHPVRKMCQEIRKQLDKPDAYQIPIANTSKLHIPQKSDTLSAFNSHKTKERHKKIPASEQTITSKYNPPDDVNRPRVK